MSVEPEEQNGYSVEKGDPPDENKLFIGGISWHMQDRELRDTFRKFGPCEARVMVDKVTGRSRGFGFVIFSNKDDMEQARLKMHDTDIDGRKVSVTKAIPQSQTAPGTPAAALTGGRRDRPPPRGYDRGYDRPPRSAGYDRAYDRRPSAGYERGYDRGYPPERAYERAAYPAEYDRYDRGYGPPPAYGYERGEAYPYDPRDSYSRYSGYEAGYDRDPGYDYDRGYAPYESRYPPTERGAYPPAERGYARAAPPLERSGSRGGGAYERAPAGYERYGSRVGGPDREYGRYASSSRPGPYERSGGGAPRGDERGPAPRI